MTIDREKLRALAEAATPGHWCVQGPWPHASVYVDDGEWSPSLVGSDVAQRNAPVHIATMPTILRKDQKCEDDRDAAFIAAANPQAVLELLAEIDRLRDDLIVSQNNESRLRLQLDGVHPSHMPTVIDGLEDERERARALADVRAREIERLEAEATRLRGLLGEACGIVRRLEHVDPVTADEMWERIESIRKEGGVE